MFHVGQFRSMITRVLNDIDPALSSPDAVELLVATAAHESELGTYLEQVRGPARGVFQMEPATFEYLRQRFLGKYADVLDKAKADHMVWDLRLATLMARLHYRLVSKPLPNRFNLDAMADYWKRFYNTAAGKGTVAAFKENYRTIVAAGEK